MWKAPVEVAFFQLAINRRNTSGCIEDSVRPSLIQFINSTRHSGKGNLLGIDPKGIMFFTFLFFLKLLISMIGLSHLQIDG